MKISQITVVKGNRTSVFANIRKWLQSPIDQLVIVDYDCPQHTGRELAATDFASDKRVQIVRVSPRVAGPFFREGHARNIGAQAAKFECLLFLDPEFFLSPITFSTLDEDALDLADVICFLPSNWNKSNYQYLKDLPENHRKESQFFVRNATFHGVNGFSEQYPDWGYLNYDFLLRAEYVTKRFMYMRPELLVTTKLSPPSETYLRYYPHTLGVDGASLQKLHVQARVFFSSQRRISHRAQPGKGIGIVEVNPETQLHTRGSWYIFEPYEDKI